MLSARDCSDKPLSELLANARYGNSVRDALARLAGRKQACPLPLLRLSFTLSQLFHHISEWAIPTATVEKTILYDQHYAKFFRNWLVADSIIYSVQTDGCIS